MQQNSSREPKAMIFKVAYLFFPVLQEENEERAYCTAEFSNIFFCQKDWQIKEISINQFLLDKLE